MSYWNELNKFWTKVIGTPYDFPLEFRIFHSICVIALIALAYNVPFNYFIGLPQVSLVSFIVLCVFCGLYYLSRFKNKVNIAVVLLAVIGNLLFIGCYFINSGINGPIDILMSVSLFLILSVVPSAQYKIWIPVNLIAVLTLHAVQYYHPELVPYTYQSTKERFFDMSSAYAVVVFLMYYTITYIRKNYEYERISSEEKAKSIELKNQYILLQNLELERLNAEKNKLMSIIAHDLKSPLGNIQNYLELLDEYALETDERKLIEKDLLKLTRNTTNMLSKLLTWSKAQMDGVAVKVKSINLFDVLSATLELEKVIGNKKGITVRYSIDPAIRILADADMLQLIIRNLVNNAIKFTLTGGEINIDALIVGDDCRLIVRDNGTGIPYEQQVELFSLKAQSTFGTENEKGVGLGLQLCKEFTELQSGKIWMESTPGQGSAFFVSLPYCLSNSV